MKMTRFTLKAFAFLAITLACATAAQAQATRTWVSGVGDDVNPCSRTAPCKTYAGAISKTADKGEISTLDPGGFGTVTITKNLTIDGTTGAGFGSILAAGTNGVNVNDSATASPNTIFVTLRNLSINGANTGFDGIRFISGKAVHVENCVIFGFRGNGTNGNGIRSSNTAVGGAVLVTVDGSHLDANNNGYLASTASIVQIANTYFTFNGTSGLNVAAGATGVDVSTCVFGSNADGILAAASTTRLGNSRISGNGNGIHFTGGTVQSFGDNSVKGNFTLDQSGGA